MNVTVGSYNVKNLFMQEDITAGSRTRLRPFVDCGQVRSSRLIKRFVAP